MYTVHLRTNATTPPVAIPNVEAGQTLLEVCLAAGVPLPHQCGGISHCTTCRVVVERGGESFEEPSRRELHVLAKAGCEAGTYRLACQCIFLEGNNTLTVRLPEP